MDDKQALLDQLHGLQAPQVSAIPAIGWWLILLALCLLGLALWRRIKLRQQRLWHRQAILEIESIRQQATQDNGAAMVKRCSVLARKLAMIAQPRSDSAATIGQARLQQLDDICGKPVFTQGTGELLLNAPYQPAPQVSETDIKTLSDALRVLADATLRYKSS